jgi:hypothetical protein
MSSCVRKRVKNRRPVLTLAALVALGALPPSGPTIAGFGIRGTEPGSGSGGGAGRTDHPGPHSPLGTHQISAPFTTGLENDLLGTVTVDPAGTLTPGGHLTEYFSVDGTTLHALTKQVSFRRPPSTPCSMSDSPDGSGQVACTDNTYACDIAAGEDQA